MKVIGRNLKGPGAFASPNRETTFFQLCRGYGQQMSVEINKICKPYAECLETTPRGSDVSQIL
jgi:hypothetical protein